MKLINQNIPNQHFIYFIRELSKFFFFIILFSKKLTDLSFVLVLFNHFYFQNFSSLKYFFLQRVHLLLTVFCFFMEIIIKY